MTDVYIYMYKLLWSIIQQMQLMIYTVIIIIQMWNGL